MGVISTTADDVFRDYVTAGVPASGKHYPEKSEIRLLFGIVDEQANIALRFDPVGADGANFFIGDNVGNETMSPGGGASTLASNNIGFGFNNLKALTTGYRNIAIGNETAPAVTTGFSNIALGYGALTLLTTGFNNVAIGDAAMGFGTTAANNTAVGLSAMFKITTGVHNSAFGLQAGYNLTTGGHNVFVGRDSGYSNTTASWNVSVGVDANPGNSTGTGNTVIGGESFYGFDFADATINQNLTGSNCTVIGYHAGSTGGAQNRQGSTAIGYLALMTADNQVVLGGVNVTETVLRGAVKAPTVTVSDSTIPANGIYLPSANNLGFATNSAIKMRIDATGNVGIGSLTAATYNYGSFVLAVGGTGAGAIGAIGIVGSQTSDSTVGNIQFNNDAIGGAALRIAQIRAARSGANNSGSMSFDVWNAGVQTVAMTIAPTGAISVGNSILSTHATAGIGYGTGAGGTVTQATSKSTGVTLNKVCGTITMHNAALNAGTSVTFTLTNSAIAATDLIYVNIKSGATASSYLVQVDSVSAGSCQITLRNYTAGNLSEAVVLSFAILEAVAA